MKKLLLITAASILLTGCFGHYEAQTDYYNAQARVIEAQAQLAMVETQTPIASFTAGITTVKVYKQDRTGIVTVKEATSVLENAAKVLRVPAITAIGAGLGVGYVVGKSSGDTAINADNGGVVDNTTIQDSYDKTQVANTGDESAVTSSNDTGNGSGLVDSHDLDSSDNSDNSDNSDSSDNSTSDSGWVDSNDQDILQPVE